MADPFANGFDPLTAQRRVAETLGRPGPLASYRRVAEQASFIDHLAPQRQVVKALTDADTAKDLDRLPARQFVDPLAEQRRLAEKMTRRPLEAHENVMRALRPAVDPFAIQRRMLKRSFDPLAHYRRIMADFNALIGPGLRPVTEIARSGVADPGSGEGTAIPLPGQDDGDPHARGRLVSLLPNHQWRQRRPARHCIDRGTGSGRLLLARIRLGSGGAPPGAVTVVVAHDRQGSGSTARFRSILMPVPEAEATVGPFRGDGDWSSAYGIPAHITIAGPWPPLLSLPTQVPAELAAAIRGTRFALRSVGTLGDAICLFPEDDHELLRQRADILAAVGAADVVDQSWRLHLTVCRDATAETIGRIEEATGAVLPIACEVPGLLLAQMHDASVVTVRQL